MIRGRTQTDSFRMIKKTGMKISELTKSMLRAFAGGLVGAVVVLMLLNRFAWEEVLVAAGIILLVDLLLCLLLLLFRRARGEGEAP